MQATPVSSNERIISLDILRGFAILGILIMNIQSFSMIGPAYMNPMAHGELTGANKLVWLISHIFADSKFITIFSILFGAGIILFVERLKAKGITSLKIHYKRTVWLLVIGLMHAYLLWFGDILVTYAMCGFLVVLMHKKKPQSLFLVGFLLLFVGFFFNLMTGLAIPSMDEASRTEILNGWQPTAEMIQKEIDAYRGSYLEQMPTRALTSVTLQTFLFIFYVGWRVAGTMLIGMGLYKVGILSAKKSNKFYILFTIISLIIGYTLVLTGVKNNIANNFSAEYSFFIGSQYNGWGSIIVAFGYIGLLNLLVKNFKINWFSRALKAVGQTALSNYILQTVICTIIFYGHGFGLYEKVERWEQILIVFVIWTVQLIISPIWLKKYNFGPLEWLWRSLTYWKFQPMKKTD